MTTLIKVDEDLPRDIAELLGARGYDAATVYGQGWHGSPDDILWNRIQGEGRLLITADKGFADLRRHPPGTHACVILLRCEEESRSAYLELTSVTLNQLNLDDIAGAVVVATFRGVRIRRAPIP
jgi:predicted nuclease of predicted toxin-antitoxin system